MRSNFIYNLIYQVFQLLIPLITIPYISRVLGAEAIGLYSLSTTYANYFILFGMLGLAGYSAREIAYVRDNENKLRKTFWELNIVRFITMGISIILYIIIFFIIEFKTDRLFKINILLLISYMIDISFLFIGLENFKKVTFRNILVKLVSLILIFIFIKTDNHLWIYGLILAFSQFLGQLIMWMDIPKNIRKVSFNKSNFFKHFKLTLSFFVPALAIQVYNLLDRLMLGELVGDYQLGLYDNAQRVIKMVSTLATALVGVTLPRMSNLYANGKIDEFKEKTYITFSFINFLVFPMCFGLIAISSNIIPWFFGEGFIGIESLFYSGSFLIITLGWTSILGNQLLVSTNNQKYLTLAVISGAIINFILNCFFIKTFQALGTTISSVVAEYTGMLIMLCFVRSFVDLKKLFKGIHTYFIVSLLMSFLIYNLSRYIPSTIFGTLILIFIGVAFYFTVMIKIKDYNITLINDFFKNLIYRYINKLKKKSYNKNLDIDSQ